MNKISIIVPCFNEEEVLHIFYDKITEVSRGIEADFEYIFVDDGSKDKTLEILKDYSKRDSRVRFISFSRNFGKESAMYAGLKAATGDYVAIMDADLQDPPDLLNEMYQTLLTKEYDCVATKRKTRKGEPALRSLFSVMFYKIINHMSKTEIVNGARDYRLMTKQMVDSILQVTEYNRFSKGIFSWVGFKTKWIAYDNIERAAGKTKWSFWKLLNYSLEGITAFSTAPLVFAAFIGIFFCMVSFLMILVIIAKTLIYGDPVSGWPSTICIILFVGGIQLFSLGIIGQYISKEYMEIKNRPIYIVKETEKDIRE
ncbi:MAG: glycosyltransferase family 2 protein [Clostridia bacterium]|nr:glycosyltransferase family 2 protein [Clostridia bacterium]